jgi:tetratricopeptide (TPR) repeat protein
LKDLVGALLFIAPALLAGSASCAEWTLQDYQYRRPLIIEDWPHGATVCHARFSHLGALAADGKDIRITDSSGRTVNHELLRLGPGDQAEVLFECNASAQAGSVCQVYFGNGKAVPPKPWTAQAGVILEVRKRGPGGFNNWNDFKKTFDASTTVMGRCVRPKIFDGQNPLGPNENYLSYYQAYFNAPAAGNYVFATNSRDASFIFIDGKKTADYPGAHNAWDGRFGQHRGNMALTAGMHKLEYYNLQGQGEPATVAGWQPPGAKNLELMPDQCFVPLGRARAGAAEIFSRKMLLDFSWTPQDHLNVAGHYLVRYAFSCGANYSGPLVWDFGDGTPAESATKTKEHLASKHCFLKPGTYTVTLSAPGKDSPVIAAKQAVAVEPVWLQREEFDDKRWTEEYAPLVLNRLKADTVRPTELLNLLVFAKELKDDKLLRLCVQPAWQAAEKLSGDEHAEVFLLLGLELQSHPFNDFKQAYDAFKEALNGSGTARLKDRARLHQAGLAVHYLGRDQEGLDLLQAITDKNLSPDDSVLKQIYQADACAGLGRREEALKRYEGLRTLAPLTDRKYAVGRSGRFFNIEQYIKRGDYDAALQELQNIEWETPQERMAGDTGRLRAQCYIAEGDFQRAAVLLERMVKLNPASPKVPEMRLLQIKAYQGLKDKEKMAEVYNKLKKEQPYAAETALAAALVEK